MGLQDNYQTDAMLCERIWNACRGIKACWYAINQPATTSARLIEDIGRSVAATMRESEEGSHHAPRADEADDSHSVPNNTFYNDR